MMLMINKHNSIILIVGIILGGLAFVFSLSNIGTHSGHLEVIGEQTGIVTSPMPDSYRKNIQLVRSWLEARGFEKIEKLPYEVEPLLSGLGASIEKQWYRGNVEGTPDFYVITQLVTDKNGDVMMHYFHVGVSWEFDGLPSRTTKQTDKVKRFIEDVRAWWAEEGRTASTSTDLLVPAINQIVIRDLWNKDAEPLIVKDKETINKVYKSAPYQEAVPLGTSYDYNSYCDIEFYCDGKRAAHISVRITGLVYDIEGREDGPFKANSNLNDILSKIKTEHGG
jgi:hypothetical protein